MFVNKGLQNSIRVLYAFVRAVYVLLFSNTYFYTSKGIYCLHCLQIAVSTVVIEFEV